LFYAGFIFTVSSIPGKEIPGLFAYQDIVFHFFEYALFALLIARAFKSCYPHKSWANRLLLVLALAIAYALLDEFHQFFVPGRSASLIDAAVDAAGSFSAAYFYK
jgi:VanZ family protein